MIRMSQYYNLPLGLRSARGKGILGQGASGSYILDDHL